MKILAATLILTWTAFANKSCSPAYPQHSNTVVEANTPQTLKPKARLTPEKVEFKGGEVNFKGVGFKYNPKVLGEIIAEEIPDYPLEDPDFRPDGVEPRHVIFTFDDCKKIYCWHGFIAIYSFPDFPRMYAVNQAMMQSMEEEVEAMRKVVDDKNVRYDGQIPYLRWVDAGQAFQAKVKLSPFDKGKGIFFVTYMDTQMALISNDHLRYIFEGLTDDGKYYVLAEIPVKVKFLPDEPPEQFDGYKEKFLYEDYETSDPEKRYKDYVSSISKRLEKLPASSFQPDLKYLEDLIATLKIEK